MTLFTLFRCEHARQRLEAYHDRELSVPEQISVGEHLDSCDECAAALGELRALRTAMLTFSRAHSAPARDNETASALGASVLGRLKAERDASFFVRVRTMFEDIRLVYAGLGAAVATVVCVVIMLGMMRFATNERPDSLAAIVTLVATPLECESGMSFADASGCRARWERRFHNANESAEAESVFALDDVVNNVVAHESGHLPNLQVLRGGRRATAGQAAIIDGLLDAVCRSRLEGDPATLVSTNMLWMVEHATVRGDKPMPLPPMSLSPLRPRDTKTQEPGPAPKKRAEHSTGSRSVTA